MTAKVAFLLLTLGLAGCAARGQTGDAMSPGPDGDPGLPVLSYRFRVKLADRSEEAKPQEFASAAPSDRFERGGRIYIGSDKGDLVAVDTRDGRVLWKQKLTAIGARPLVHRGRVYVGTNDGTLYCVAEADGTVQWKYTTRGPILEPPIISGDLLLFSNEVDHVYALDRNTGAFRWQFKTETPEEFTLRGHAGVAVDAKQLYTGFADGTVVALDMQTGAVVWAKSLKGEADQFVDVDSTPILIGGSVYVTSSTGGLYGLDSKNGEIRWRLPVQAAGPIATDGSRLYMAAANQGIYAVDLQGNVVWRQGTHSGGEPAIPAINDEFVLYALSDAGLFVADKSSGRVVQYFDPGFGVSGSPTLVGEDLYVLSNSAILYAFDVNKFR